MNRNPKHRLGALRDAEDLKEHAFFKMIDWKALAAKQVTPPFIPVVESDESTANFDPEFTSADISDAGVGQFDDDDPSEDWLSQSLNSSLMMHTPNGPLGSDLKDSPVSNQTSPKLPSAPSTDSGTKSKSSSSSGGVQINGGRKRRTEPQGSPISHSVQENFRGFSFSGESFVDRPQGRLADEEQVEDAVDDEFDFNGEENVGDGNDNVRLGGRIARQRGEV